MSRRESLARYSLIINRLRKRPATLMEIFDYLEVQGEIDGYNYNISRRTFQRDMEDIRSLYNIDIIYDFSQRVYRIDYDEDYEVNERILEAFDTLNALNATDRLSGHIHFEKRKPQGTENLYGILHAVKNNLQITFTYRKFWDDIPTPRAVQPYGLKEFRNRWYVMAADTKDDMIKTFALDRLTDLEITKKHFKPDPGYDPSEQFRYCFGIVGPDEGEPEEVILSFNPLQGKYIKTLPLHHTQEIITDNDKELRVRLQLYITYDLIMELLSHGDNLKVISPRSLADEIKSTLKSTLKLYARK